MHPEIVAITYNDTDHRCWERGVFLWSWQVQAWNRDIFSASLDASKVSYPASYVHIVMHVDGEDVPYKPYAN